MKVGIIGAGSIASAIGELASHAGHTVMLSNSRGGSSLQKIANRLGAATGSVKEAVEFGDLVVIAIHLQSTYSLPNLPTDKKVFINPQNYFPQFGAISSLESGQRTTAEIFVDQFPEARVVKAFNAILAEDIVPDARPQGHPERRALPIASDYNDAKLVVSEFCDSIGYDTVDAGILKEGWRFERRRPAYCVPLDRSQLSERLAATSPNSFVPEGYWQIDRGIRS